MMKTRMGQGRRLEFSVRKKEVGVKMGQKDEMNRMARLRNARDDAERDDDGEFLTLPEM